MSGFRNFLDFGAVKEKWWTQKSPHLWVSLVTGIAKPLTKLSVNFTIAGVKPDEAGNGSLFFWWCVLTLEGPWTLGHMSGAEPCVLP